MQENKKIKKISDLTEILKKIRSEKKIVLCHGVFDLLHIGHIRYFEQAKKHGDFLVVTVTPDRFVNKGPERPAFPEDLRVEAIAALDIVDYVAINEWPTAVETIRLLKPDIYAKGSEYKNIANDMTGKIVEEEDAVKAVGGSIIFTEDIVFSSSQLINTFFSIFPDETRVFLKQFSNRYTSKDIIQYLKNAEKLKILVIGETIIDEYNYCEPIGMTTKDPIIAVKYLSKEKFAGGVLAAANHLANFCHSVDIITMLGEFETDEQYVRDTLNPAITPVFFYKRNSPTIVKRRFIDNYLSQKLFELHEINDNEIDKDQETLLNEIFKEKIPEYDMVIVIDYGHGMITKDLITTICNHAKFLAVNTQSNAGNRGFNVISKYTKANFICLNNSELNLEERDRNCDIKESIVHVSEKISCPRILITRGRYGNIYFDADEGYVETPAFATQVVDRMGAGDAVISFSSLYAFQNAPKEVVGFIANTVASQAVATVGHRTSIEPVPLYKHITSLMK
jgi:rfaE bifunctional protein kinase chain/domain/rfaE bifunctional protein nucleotidyltransferase chain/domain